MQDTLVQLECVDCHTLVEIKFCLLTSGNRVVYLTSCGRCRDFATMRLYKVINNIDWLEAATRGLPVVTFKRVESP